MEINKIGVRVYREYSSKYFHDLSSIYSNRFNKERWINNRLFGIEIHKRYKI